MDFKDILNDEAEPSTTRKPRHSSASQSRSSTLPALNTSISESPGVTRSLTATENYYTQSQSHEQHPHQPPPHAQAQYGHPYISGSPSQYQPSPATPSAYTHGNPPGVQQPPVLNRQFSHPSQISTPSSHPQTPHGLQHHSPISSRSISYQAPIQHAPPPQSHSGTPMGERMYLSPQVYSLTPPVSAVAGPLPYPPQLHTPGPRQSMPRPPQLLSSGSRESVPGYPHLSNDRGPGVPMTSMSPPAPPRPMYGAPPPYPRPQQSRNGSSIGVPGRERTHSVSVSPKTMVVDLPPSRNVSLNGSSAGQSAGAVPDRAENEGFAHPGSVGARTSSTTSNFLKDPTPQEKRKTARKSHEAAPEMSSPLTRMRSRDNPETQAVVAEDPTSELSLASHDNVPDQAKSMTGIKRALDSDPVLSSQPPAKKRRGGDIPIWARQAKNTAPLPKYRNNGPTNGNMPQRPAPASVAQPIQAQLPRVVAAADRATAANLEDSILAVVPMDEVHKTLCDFLFEQVVVNDAFGTLQAGQAAQSNNLGVLEIEAKLGTILDRHTNERISVGALTETVVSSGSDIAFESMMTEEQHATYNKMLNDAVAQSLGIIPSAPAPQTSRRVPIEYVHRHEIDSFYPLPQEDMQVLPQAIIKMNRGRNLSIRVTKDQKTGATLAQIVKVRLKDVHIHSPRSLFDWRVSVNAEVQWSGNVAQLMAEAKKDSQGKAQPDRRKDRMSYKHQYCQVDLTQVKAVAGVGSDKATHELEVELDAAELREQGKKILAQAPNCYEPLVRTLVNNVRLLVRRYAYT